MLFIFGTFVGKHLSDVHRYVYGIYGTIFVVLLIWCFVIFIIFVGLMTDVAFVDFSAHMNELLWRLQLPLPSVHVYGSCQRVSVIAGDASTSALCRFFVITLYSNWCMMARGNDCSCPVVVACRSCVPIDIRKCVYLCTHSSDIKKFLCFFFSSKTLEWDVHIMWMICSIGLWPFEFWFSNFK